MHIKPLITICLISLVFEAYSVQRLLSDVTRNDDSFQRIKKQNKDCGSKISIKDCVGVKQIRVMEKNLLHANYEKGTKCNIAETKFDWTVKFGNKSQKTFDNYHGKDVFSIEPYMLRAGEHTIELNVREVLAGTKETVPMVRGASCNVSVPIEEPKIVITAVPELPAACGKELVMHADNSIDYNVAPGEPYYDLKFMWGCMEQPAISVIDSEYCPQFADGSYGDSKYIIPADAAMHDVALLISLAGLAHGKWIFESLVVKYKCDVKSKIEIKCIKNCPPIVDKSHNQKSIILQAVCLEGCNFNEYKWYVSTRDYKYSLDSKYGRYNETFHIYDNTLLPGKDYTITVFLKGTTGVASIKIHTYEPPVLDSCTINPREGIAMKTKFTTNCQYTNGTYTFEIYNTQNDIDILIMSGKKLEDLHFTLPAGTNAKVKLIDEYGFTDEKVVPVTVTASIKSTGTDDEIEAEILNNYFGENSESSLDKLMEKGDYNKVLEVANNLLGDLNALKDAGKEELAKKYHLKVLEMLEKIPMDTGTKAAQIGSTVTKITKPYNTKTDPDIASKGTKLCAQASQKILNDLKNEKHPHKLEDSTKNIVGTLAKCSQAGATENLDIIQSNQIDSGVATPFPLLDIPAITENYPDYMDDQNSSQVMSKLDESSRSVIELCYASSKLLAQVMTPYENTLFREIPPSFNVTSTLKLGKDILEAQVESHSITLIPSRDFLKNKESLIHIAMCTNTENIFWWAQKGEIFTSIAIIQFNEMEKTVKDFTKPFSLTFPVSRKVNAIIKIHEQTTPYIQTDDETEMEMIYENVDIYRIVGLKKKPFVVEFRNLEANAILNVVITHFFKPTYGQFKRRVRKVHSRDNKVFTTNDKPYDSWYYLIVMPNSTMSSSTEYSFTVYSVSCFRWVISETKWEFACGSTEVSSRRDITCNCYSSSVIVGIIDNNDIVLEETLIEELELETQASYIIFISVAIAFFLYCVFLIWFSIKKRGDEVLAEMIFFLSDVPNTYRYGYLLIVKTGNKAKAGTTSNVTIKIYGTKSQSDEHVLNYPDPEKQLLQRNEENWFFLATEYYLGDIEKIELWCDSIGYNPSWFCADIEIFDIQEEKYWLFEINKWFEVLKNENMTCTAFPEQQTEYVSKKRMFINTLKRFKNSFRGPHMWNVLKVEEQVITRMRRLHIIYSIFMTTYMMGLYLYGVPKLEDSDCLAYTLHYKIDKFLVLNTLGCFLITFAMHFPIVWFFRYPRDNIFGKYQTVLKQYPVGTDDLCWLFLFTNIIISMTLLIILGFWIPHITALQWLTSVIISLLIYIFVLENIMRVIVSFTTKQKLRIQGIFRMIKSAIGVVEKQRAALYKSFGAVLLRPFFQHLYKPLDLITLREQRYWAEIKLRLWEIVQDIIMITLYVTLLYLVILMDRDPMTYISHAEINDLIKGYHHRTLRVNKARNRKQMEDYVNKTLVPTMQSFQWYGKFVNRNPGLTIDKTNKFLGVARLRQHRTYPVPCVDFINVSRCTPTYFWHPEYRNFSEGWQHDRLSNKFSRMDSVWNYVSQWYSGTAKYVGLFAVYPGGGYTAHLGRTIQNSVTNFNYLINNKWIDDLTRSIFIEFLMYNPCNNLFNAVSIVFEFYPTGFITSKLNVHTAQLLFVKEKTGIMIWTILISFLAILTIIIIKLGFKFYHKRKLILKDAWLIVDVVIIVMSLTCLGLYASRSDAVKLFLNKVENSKNNEFVNYFHLMYTEKTLTIIAALLVFLATLRLWKLMRFMLIVKIVERTLILSIGPMLCLMLYQINFLLACALFGILKYGQIDKDFSGVGATATTLMITSLSLYEDFDFESIKGIGYLFYSMFMLVMLSFFTISICIITISYEQAQFEFSSEEEYNITNLIKERYEYYSEIIKVKCRKFRLRGGNEKYAEYKRVTPKADEFRYARCLTVPTSRLEAMTLVTKCLLRNMKKKKQTITDNDANLIKHTIVSLFRKDSGQKEIFFVSNIESEKTKLVDDRLMLKMEALTEEFLTPSEERSYDEGRRRLYKKIVDSHERKMKDISDNLNVLRDVINAINFDIQD